MNVEKMNTDLDIPVPSYSHTTPTALGSKIEKFMGLEKVVDYFNATIYRKFDEVLYILCDCDRAIDYVLDKNLECSSALKRRFDAYVNQLEQAKVKVFLVWIPSHSNIQGNEIADTLAKQVAKDIETNRMHGDRFHAHARKLKHELLLRNAHGK